MLTPQELQNRATFEKAVFGGYNMKEVDDLLVPLTEDYSALYRENAVLKSQLKVVVDKLEAYHKQEESMNRAMIAAQKTADEMVAETERKCSRMLADTEQLLRKRKEALQAELDEETEQVELAKKTTREYVSEMERQVRRCLGQLQRIRTMTGGEETEAEPDPEEPADVHELCQQPEQPEQSEQPEQPEQPTAEQKNEEVTVSRMEAVTIDADAVPAGTAAPPAAKVVSTIKRNTVEALRAENARAETETISQEIDLSVQKILERAARKRRKERESKKSDAR